VDAIGSGRARASLPVTRSGPEEFSDRFERRAHYIVIAGLGIVGVTTIVASALLLITDASPLPSSAERSSPRSRWWRWLHCRRAKPVGRTSCRERALLGRGHLSAIGALQAAVALAGLLATRMVGLGAADAVAAIAVGVVALTLAILS